MTAPSAPRRWYEGISGYQWLVLAIASLGWVFDIFESQLLVRCRTWMLPELAPDVAGSSAEESYFKYASSAFLIGGALGGILFGMLSDRIGRTRTLIYTILMYSLFTGLTALSQNWWQMCAFRFLMAMGTGGEWAVGVALVAEVFPMRSRAWSGAIFHGSSVMGTLLAVAAVDLLGGPAEWRWAFLVGVAPALLCLIVRWRLKEPEAFVRARETGQADRSKRGGRIADLFGRELRRRTLVGLGLATVGLVTFWGVHVFGITLAEKNAMEHGLLSAEVADAGRRGMILTTMGGGLGLFAFAPICELLKRRGAFLFFQLGGLVSTLLLFGALRSAPGEVVLACLPVFGFLTLGMHAGYAIYFPELFPTRLRGTGAGLCFNGGRLTAAILMIGSGLMEDALELEYHQMVMALSLLFIPACLLLLAAPETKGKELPE